MIERSSDGKPAECRALKRSWTSSELTVPGCRLPRPFGRDHWRAGCRETGLPCVRREALRCIPDAVGRNLEECSWVAWLTWTRKREGTTACQESGGRLEASRAACCETRAIWPRLDCLKPNLQRCKGPPIGTTLETDAASCPGVNSGAGATSRARSAAQ